jgi:hypothetical protein
MRPHANPMPTRCQPDANPVLTPCQPHANPMPTPCQPHAKCQPDANPMPTPFVGVFRRDPRAAKPPIWLPSPVWRLAELAAPPGPRAPWPQCWPVLKNKTKQNKTKPASSTLPTMPIHPPTPRPSGVPQAPRGPRRTQGRGASPRRTQGPPGGHPNRSVSWGGHLHDVSAWHCGPLSALVECGGPVVAVQRDSSLLEFPLKHVLLSGDCSHVTKGAPIICINTREC